MRISDWSSDVCSSDLTAPTPAVALRCDHEHASDPAGRPHRTTCRPARTPGRALRRTGAGGAGRLLLGVGGRAGRHRRGAVAGSEEHTSELQSLMRISYAVFCLKKKKNNARDKTTTR